MNVAESDDVEVVKRELIATATTPKQERFLRSVADKLRATPRSGNEFLDICARALRDPENKFEELDRIHLRIIIPEIAQVVFPPELAADIRRHSDRMKLHTGHRG